MGPGILADKTITIVYGVDLVNVNYLNFCSNKVEVASAWCSQLWHYVRQINPLSISSMQNLRKIHTQLCLFSNEGKSIEAKKVVKFFAQNRDDRKEIIKALEASGLPSEKNDKISMANFDFEEFQVFYKTLLKRQDTDVASVFEKFCTGWPARTWMDKKEFLTFLNNSQRDPRLNEILHPYATEEKSAALINKYEPDQTKPELQSPSDSSSSSTIGEDSWPRLSVDGFMWYLMSEDSGPIYL